MTDLPSSTPITANGHPKRSIGTLARDATSWLYQILPDSKATAQPLVRGQRIGETLLGNSRGVENNDDKILDCARYYLEKEEAQVFLLSNDRILCVKAKVEGIDSISVGDSMSPIHLMRKVDRHLSVTTLSPKSGSPSPPSTIRSSESMHKPPEVPRKNQEALVPSSPEHKATGMDLDPCNNPPDFSPIVQPSLLSPFNSLAIFLNIQLLIQHFLARPLALHLFQNLKASQPESQFEWQEGFRDWRSWTAGHCLTLVKQWWKTGDLESICLQALLQREREKRLASSPLPLLASTVSTPSSSIERRQKGSNRAASRWAPSSSDSVLRKGSTPAIIAKANSPVLSSRSTEQTPPSRVIPAQARLKELYNSMLPNLTTMLSTPNTEIANWSKPRWEILLEGVEEVLVVVLGGLVGADLSKDVRGVVEGWIRDLEGL